MHPLFPRTVKKKDREVSVRSESGTASQVAGQARPKEAEEKRRRLVLDYILAEIGATRRIYYLREATFGLEQIEQEPVAKPALERIIRDTLARHGTEIYSKMDPMFDKICDIRCGKRLDEPSFDARGRIPPVRAAKVLRLLLERALQTIVQLPKKDAPLKDGKRDLKRLASHCEKLAKEMDRVFKRGVVCHHAMVYFCEGHSPGLEQFYRQAKELKRIAETIRAILAKARSKKQKMDSPHPQVRLALSLIAWLKESTGKMQYAPFKALLDGAYAAKGMDPPPWVDRLEIEMTRDRARRKAFAKSITVQSPFPIPPRSLQNPD